MKNTDKNGRNRLFIISFGDSRKYRVEINAGETRTPFADYEKELNDYLNAQFPDEPFAYFTTPRITEVEYAHKPDYAAYPEMSRAAMDDIKHELLREVRVMNATRRLDSNDAWGR